MGWTTFEKPADVEAYFNQQLTWESDSEARRVLDSVLTRKALYSAVEITDKSSGEVTVTAVIVLLEYSGSMVTYKGLGETDGPVISDCPLRILDRLSPTDNENAMQWRDRCRRRAGLKVPPVGACIRFERPLTFTDGVEEAEFTVERYGTRAKRFRRRKGGVVRITRDAFKSLPWRLVGSFG